MRIILWEFITKLGILLCLYLGAEYLPLLYYVGTFICGILVAMNVISTVATVSSLDMRTLEDVKDLCRDKYFVEQIAHGVVWDMAIVHALTTGGSTGLAPVYAISCICYYIAVIRLHREVSND